MASLNKVQIIGRLGKDCESRYTPSGDCVTNITVATSESFKDKTTGDKREVVEWHRVVFWGKIAEIAAQFLRKGSQVYIEGKLQTRKFTNKEGVEQYTTEIKADQMQMLDAKPSDAGTQAPAPRQPTDAQRATGAPPHRQQAARPAPDFSDMDSDIPFSNPYRGKYSYVV